MNGETKPGEINRRWLLERRPRGEIRNGDFRWDEQPVPKPGEGEVVVRVAMLSCDPTQRPWLDLGESYLPPVEVGDAMRSVGAGQIVASRNPDYAVGDVVAGLLRWEDYVQLAPTGVYQLGKLPPGLPLERALWALGPTGSAAYFGLLDVGKPKPGETVVVSGAAGATGSLAGQIAKIQGCRVVGIAGGSDKCRWLTEVAGFDAAIDYKAGPIDEHLRDTCPEGIDIYFDNVGGATLNAALGQIAMRGRVVLCGAIAQYNVAEKPPGPANYFNLIPKRGRMEGFIVIDYASRQVEMMTALLGWLAEGKLTDRVDVQEGLENAPTALHRLFTGENKGKQLVRVAVLV